MFTVSRLLKALTSFLALVGGVGAVSYDMQWRTGRSTFYGGPTDSWSIHSGACNYGYLYGSDPLGWNVAAMNDGNPLYEDSCGKCVEVKCDPRWITDNYGGSYDRTAACFNPAASVIVRITDDCPCTYPANAYSNKRWCCDDVEHLDMSIWAFEKLALTKWGVIGLQYRGVPCNYLPTLSAPRISNATPGIQPPNGNIQLTRDWPDMSTNRADSLFLYKNGYQNGFGDASWTANIQSYPASSNKGMHNGAGLCANILPNGALGLKGPSGAFNGRVGLQFFVYVGQTGYNGGGVSKPNIRINLSGARGGCSPVRIYDIQPIYFEPATIPYSSDYFWGWQVYFPAFAGAAPGNIINNPASFNGCGGNGAQDLTTVTFRNDGNSAQWVCLDHIELI